MSPKNYTLHYSSFYINILIISLTNCDWPIFQILSVLAELFENTILEGSVTNDTS